MVTAFLAAGVMVTGAQAAGFDGPYIGADAAYTVASMPGSDSTQLNYGVNAGYGKTFGKFYLAGEAELRNAAGDFGNREAQTTKTISVIPGYVISPTSMIYAKYGFGNTDLRYQNVTENYDINVMGLGYSKLMTNNVDLNVEVNKTGFTKSGLGNVDIVGVNVGVNYRF